MHNQGGSANVAIGRAALMDSVAGDYNVAIGRSAGIQTDGSSNILINSTGASGESNVLRIGSGSGTGSQQLDKAFIQGIHGSTLLLAEDVFVSSNGQLGVPPSSARFKQDVQDLVGIGDRLAGLRPVSFRYKDEMAREAGVDNPIQYGLIAEEVEKLFPELVAIDEEGRPLSVRYHLLTPLVAGRGAAPLAVDSTWERRPTTTCAAG